MQPYDRMMQRLDELGWKDAYLYNLLGITKQRFNGWKKRGSIPKDMIEPVAQAVLVSVQWLMTGKGEKSIKEGSAYVETPDWITPVNHDDAMAGVLGSSSKAQEISQVILRKSAEGTLPDEKIEAIATLLDYQPGKLAGMADKIKRRES